MLHRNLSWIRFQTTTKRIFHVSGNGIVISRKWIRFISRSHHLPTNRKKIHTKGSRKNNIPFSRAAIFVRVPQSIVPLSGTQGRQRRYRRTRANEKCKIIFARALSIYQKDPCTLTSLTNNFVEKEIIGRAEEYYAEGNLTTDCKLLVLPTAFGVVFLKVQSHSGNCLQA